MSGGGSPTSSSNRQSPSRTNLSNIWITIEEEDLEGCFEPPLCPDNWTVIDQSNDGYERYWDKDDHNPHEGGWAA